VLVGITAFVAMTSDVVPANWQRVFQGIAIAAVAILVLTIVFLTRRGRYLGPLFEAMYRYTGWGWTEGRVAHFISDVETIFLELARSDLGRLRLLVLLAVACYAAMALEVWLVFWAIGLPISVWNSMFVETFTRSASIFAGAIPANLGAMEASNVVVVRALGLAGAGSLALARRIRGLFWAGLGLTLYPRDTLTSHPARQTADEGARRSC
jgi:hypothetical protein